MKLFDIIFLLLTFFAASIFAELPDLSVFDRVDQSNIGFKDKMRLSNRNQPRPIFLEKTKLRRPRNPNSE
uniref:Uncharacterized protein n=1 Tax=Panagrolaimus sp. ES5 TaxID=591445 RepID=A0AC34GJT5_9BILA